MEMFTLGFPYLIGCLVVGFLFKQTTGEFGLGFALSLFLTPLVGLGVVLWQMHKNSQQK